MKVLLILSCFILTTSLFPAVDKKKKKKLPKVFIDKLVKVDISDKIDYIGQLRPLNEISLYSPIEGVVTWVIPQLGKRIKKNQVLAIIKQNVIGLDVLPVKIKSPISGHILRPKISKNNFVRKNTHLFSVYDSSQYKLELNISPTDSKFIDYGDKVKIDITGEIYQGTIGSLSHDIDPITGTKVVEIYLEKNIKEITPGVLAKAKFNFNERKGYLLSKKYIQKNGGKYFVRIEEKGKVKRVSVEILSRIKNMVEIKSNDLTDNQKLIIKSSVEPLLDKQEVEVVKKDKV